MTRAMGDRVRSQERSQPMRGLEFATWMDGWAGGWVDGETYEVGHNQYASGQKDGVMDANALCVDRKANRNSWKCSALG